MYDKMMEVSRHKDPVKVYVKCSDGDYFTGNVYLETRQRLSDLMNDSRGFVPLQQDNGRLVVVAKSSIRWIGDLVEDGND
jgi:hypothetical protein